jgi:hypothetical protein
MSTFETTGEMKKLEGVGRQGDFVLEGQTIAKDEGFKNVSKIWYDKTISIGEAREKLAHGRETQEDTMVDAAKLSPYYNEETGEVGLEDWGREKQYKLTAHAWRQYATRIDVPHTVVNYFLQEESLKPNGKPKFTKDVEDAKTFYDVMMNNRRHFDSGKLMLRTYNDSVCRAVVTDKYTPIDNDWFLRTLGDLIPGGRVSHHDYCDADTLRFNILIPDTIRSESDSDYGGMVSVTNCEIGTRTNSGTPSLFRAICMNGCIWDQTKGVSWKQIHKGKVDYADLTKVMALCIQEQIPLVEDVIKKFLVSREWELGKTTVQQILTQLCIDYSLNGDQATNLFESYSIEKGESGFSIVNAVTRFAQTQDADLWRKMDSFAGNLIETGDKAWERLVSRAQHMTDEDLKKVVKKQKQQSSVFGLVAAI